MSSLWIVLAGILLLAVIATSVYGGVVWARRRTYTRERFAFAALTAVASLTVTLLTSLATKKTPWHLVAEIGQLTLPDAVLHRVAGTWILPWLKGQPFDYYLEDRFSPPADRLAKTEISADATKKRAGS